MPVPKPKKKRDYFRNVTPVNCRIDANRIIGNVKSKFIGNANLMCHHCIAMDRHSFNIVTRSDFI